MTRVTQARADGRRTRWTAHRAARRDELIDAAVRAISRHGATVGMDQIAAVARTSKPVIYRYFTDKTDLYRAVSERVVGHVLATLRAVIDDNPSPRQMIHASVDAYLGLLEQNPELYRFIAQHPVAGGDPDPDAELAGVPVAFSRVVADLLSARLREQLVSFGLDAAVADPWGEAIVGFINGASLWWLDHRDVMSRRELGDYLSALLWGGAAGVHQFAGHPADPVPADGVFPRIN